ADDGRLRAKSAMCRAPWAASHCADCRPKAPSPPVIKYVASARIWKVGFTVEPADDSLTSADTACSDKVTTTLPIFFRWDMKRKAPATFAAGNSVNGSGR